MRVDPNGAPNDPTGREGGPRVLHSVSATPVTGISRVARCLRLIGEIIEKERA
jgi:hypothetical protein